MRYSKPVLVLPAFVLVCLLSANDTAAPKRPEMFDFFKSGVTMGYERDNLLLCTPEFNERPRQLSREYILNESKKQDQQQDFQLIPIPDTFAMRYLKDIPGDTVMALWSGGKFKAVINDIVYYRGTCFSGFECVLKPITEIKDKPKRYYQFITLRKEKFYDGPVIPYTEYQVDDPSYLAIVDSLTGEMNRSWLAEDSARFEAGLAYMAEGAGLAYKAEDAGLANTAEDRKEQYIAFWKKMTSDANYPFYEIHFNLYGIESEEVPDTLYLMVVGDLSYATEFSWVAQLELSRFEGGWKTRTISEPATGSYSNVIRFAFDLNSDGVWEYFINNSIYILFNGVFARALGGPYRGC